jgi:hypothetical protein
LTISHTFNLRVFRTIAFLGAALCVAAGGCDSGERQSTVTRGISRSAPTVTREAPASRPGFDIHKVDWANVSLPGAVCGFRRPIHLHRHNAFVKAIPRRFPHLRANQRESGLPRGVAVYSGWTPVAYGDLDGRNGDEAGLAASCNNGGGTADGGLAYAWVIFKARKGTVSPLGIITARVQRPHELPTTLLIMVKRGRVKVREAWYGYWDGTCCPSGRATTTWTYSHGRLHAGAPVIIKRPSKHS